MTSMPSQGSPGFSPDTTLRPLILDLLDWLAPAPRPYAEVMAVWRTSCPRLPVWEEAVDQGLVMRRQNAPAGPPMVSLTDAGKRLRNVRT